MSLSTHVLDTSLGAPAAGIRIDLHLLREDAREHLKTVSTNADGRTDEPLLATSAIVPGIYELTFHAAEYFRKLEVPLPEPPFLDEIVIRFGISDTDRRYHVPLLLAPYAYSTYRGS